jgi:uncharacterized delta-60 repeat protein
MNTIEKPGAPGQPDRLSHAAQSLAAALLMATALCPVKAYSAPQGELDASFGDHGRVLLRVGSGNGADAVAQQPADGKLLVAGQAGYSFTVTRLNTDGTLDESFGMRGVAYVAFGGSFSRALDLAIQADGQILAVGYTEQTEPWSWDPATDFAIARLNPDGTLDRSFGDGGKVSFHLGSDQELFSRVVVLRDGRFVAAGTRAGTTVFARFTADGALDPTFGTGAIPGVVSDKARARGGSWWLKAMHVLDNGALVACGYRAVIRLLADGSMDPGFGTDGAAEVRTGTATDRAESCVGMPDGTTVVAGADGPDLLLYRLTPDGNLDTTFADGGIARIDLHPDLMETATAIVLLADGRLGVSGVAEKPGPSHRTMRLLFFARIDATSGLPDPTFGHDGMTLVSFGALDSRSMLFAPSMIRQADGKLVAVGTQSVAGEWDWSQSLALARVDPAGAGSVGFAGFAETFPPFPRESAEIAVAVQRLGGSTGTLSVDYSVSRGGVQVHTGTLAWLTGDMDPKFITVPTGTNGDQSYSFSLSNSTGGLATSMMLPVPAPGNSQSGGGNGGGGAAGPGFLMLLAGFSLLSAWRTRAR